MSTEEHAAVIASGDQTGTCTVQPDCYVLGFSEIDATQIAVAGGKGAHLGELSQIEGIRVPPGFCVTTNAFRRIMAEAPSVDDRLDRLSRLKPDDRAAIRALSAEIRRTIEGIAIPDDLTAATTRARSPRSATKPPTPSDPVQRRKTCPRPPSRASRIRI